MEPYFEDEDKWTKIYKCNCITGMKQLGNVAIDATITDPPYGVGIEYEGPYEDKKDEKYWELMEGWFRLAKLLSRVIVFTPGTINLSKWIKIEEPYWIGCWYHPNCSSHNRIGSWCHWEPILIYGKPYKRVSKDAWHIPIGWQSAVGDKFPVPKPEKLFDQLVLEFTNEGDTVLDPFCGSGTTLRCCKKLHRKCIGMDIAENACKLSADRCRQKVMEL